MARIDAYIGAIYLDFVTFSHNLLLFMTLACMTRMLAHASLAWMHMLHCLLFAWTHLIGEGGRGVGIEGGVGVGRDSPPKAPTAKKKRGGGKGPV